MGIITSITPNCNTILGYSEHEMININIQKYCNISLEDTITHRSFHTEIIKKDGSTSYFDIYINSIVNNDNTIIGYCLSLIDISNYREIERRGNNLQKMLECSKDIICSFQIIPEPKMIYISPCVKDMLGYSVEEFQTNPMIPFEIVHPDDYEIQQSKIKSNTDFSKLFQARFKHKDGYYLWLEDYIIPTYNQNGQLIEVDTICRNIQDKKEMEEKLKKLSYTDALTGLYNRTYLNKQIQLFSEEANMPIAVIVCDLDDFKYINDTFGHLEGNTFLKNVAILLDDIFPDDSIIVRSGGDEFLIIIASVSLKEAEGIYSTMLLALNKHNEIGKIQIRLSTGFAYSNTSKNILEQINKADKAMYKNKYIRKLATNHNHLGYD